MGYLPKTIITRIIYKDYEIFLLSCSIYVFTTRLGYDYFPVIGKLFHFISSVRQIHEFPRKSISICIINTDFLQINTMLI